MDFNIVTNKKVSSKSIYLSLFVTFDNQYNFVHFYIVIHISFYFKNPLIPNRFYHFRWINQGPYLVGIHKICFKFQGL